jgi:hypothetical protein
MNKIIALRIIHGLFAAYFILCLFYIYYAAFFSKIDIFLLVSILSLVVEGIAVFVLNNGDCPLIHLQKKIGDNTPFFRLFLSPTLAKQAVPFLAKAAWIGIVLVVVRLVINNV